MAVMSILTFNYMKSIHSSLIKALITSPIASIALLFGSGGTIAPQAIAQTVPSIKVTTTVIDSPQNIYLGNPQTPSLTRSSIPIRVIPAPDYEPNQTKYLNITPGINSNNKRGYIYIPPANNSDHNNIAQPELRAFLDVISWAETGTTDFSSYSKLVFKGSFNNFSTHPKITSCKVVSGRRICSNAAGRYQMMGFNWDKLAPKLGLKDFSPQSQDRMALYFIQKKGAMEDILSGRFETAVCKLGGTWASFPCNNYRQYPKSMDILKQVYLQQLGQYQGVPQNTSSVIIQRH